MAFPALPTNGQLYTDPSGRVWNYTAATLKWETVGTAKKNNYVATVTPAATNDSSQGYSVGSLWVDVTANLSYTCVDATATAAVWQPMSQVYTGAAIINVPADYATAELAYDSLLPYFLETDVTIQIANGTYGAVGNTVVHTFKDTMGAGRVIITGNITTATSVIINTGGWSFDGCSKTVTVGGFKLLGTSATVGNGLFATNGSQISINHDIVVSTFGNAIASSNTSNIVSTNANISVDTCNVAIQSTYTSTMTINGTGNITCTGIVSYGVYADYCSSMILVNTGTLTVANVAGSTTGASIMCSGNSRMYISGSSLALSGGNAGMQVEDGGEITCTSPTLTTTDTLYGIYCATGGILNITSAITCTARVGSTGNGITVADSSTISSTGAITISGFVNGIYDADSSNINTNAGQLTISGFTGNGISCFLSSVISNNNPATKITGGQYGLQASVSSTIFMLGGTITAATVNGVYSVNNSTIYIPGITVTNSFVGYVSNLNAWILALNTNINNVGNTTNYNLASNTASVDGSIITWT